MLREQLKVIQEEFNESEGTAGDDGYRQRIENSKMPEDIRKKALAEARKLETGGSQNHEFRDPELPRPPARSPLGDEEKKSIDIGAAPAGARKPPQRP